MANFLSLEKKALVLNSLVEGNSIRSTVRLTGVNKKTVMRLLVEAGEQAREILDRELVNIQSRFVEADEIWCYVGKKQKQVTQSDNSEIGDQYVFVAMDAETKLITSYLVGKRNFNCTLSFIKDLANHNTPTRVIGLKLGRTPSAVYAKASEKHISLEPHNRAPYGPRKKK